MLDHGSFFLRFTGFCSGVLSGVFLLEVFLIDVFFFGVLLEVFLAAFFVGVLSSFNDDFPSN